MAEAKRFRVGDSITWADVDPRPPMSRQLGKHPRKEYGEGPFVVIGNEPAGEGARACGDFDQVQIRVPIPQPPGFTIRGFSAAWFRLVELARPRYLVITINDAHIIAAALLAEEAPEAKRIRARMSEDTGADLGEIVELLKGLDICAACNIEGQASSCQSITAHKLGRRLRRVVERAGPGVPAPKPSEVESHVSALRALGYRVIEPGREATIGEAYGIAPDGAVCIVCGARGARPLTHTETCPYQGE